MKATEKLSDTHENYTRLISEIESQNRDLRQMLTTATDPDERSAYFNAIIRNEMAINRIASDRLQLTIEVFSG